MAFRGRFYPGTDIPVRPLRDCFGMPD